MKITEEAKSMLTELLSSNDCDCVKASLQESCCGTSLVLSVIKLQEGDTPVSVNGVPVLMSEEATNRAESVTITVENGDLVILDGASSGCC